MSNPPLVRGGVSMMWLGIGKGVGDVEGGRRWKVEVETKKNKKSKRLEEAGR